eukprot:1279642-Amphidinium_carterae.1
MGHLVATSKIRSVLFWSCVSSAPWCSLFGSGAVTPGWRGGDVPRRLCFRTSLPPSWRKRCRAASGIHCDTVAKA